MPSPSKKRPRPANAELRVDVPVLSSPETLSSALLVIGHLRYTLSSLTRPCIDSISLVIPSNPSSSISLAIASSDQCWTLDITHYLSSTTIEEIAEHIRSSSMQFMYTCQLGSQGVEILVYVALQSSEMDEHPRYSFDCLCWSLGELRSAYPWVDLYASLPRGNRRGENMDTKAIAAQLLEDISSDREDQQYSLQEVQALKTELRDRGLVTQLRQYQLKGVLWLRRRMSFALALNVDETTMLEQGTLDGWMPLTLLFTQQRAWFSVLTGELGTMREAHLIVHGGILGDFMGLGKSVQVLALVLLSIDRTAPPIDALLFSKPKEGSSSTAWKSSSAVCVCGHRQLAYCQDLIECEFCGKPRHSSCMLEASAVCFDCICSALYAAPRQTGAALLVLPRGLVSQWLAEVRKHLPSREGRDGLRVFVYEGVSRCMQAAKSDGRISTYIFELL